MSSAKEIMRLESKFWQAMCDEDIETAVSLLNTHSAVAGAMGIHHFDKAGYKKMAEEGLAKLKTFEFSNDQVFFPTPDVAIATYTVKQSFEMGGKAQEMTSFDTTTWVKKDGTWVATAHTESPQQQK